VGDSRGGCLPSDAGALLLRQVDRQIGLTRKLADYTNVRHPGYVRHSVLHLLRQRIGAIALGCEDLNDPTPLREDPANVVRSGRPVAKSPGVRFLHRDGDGTAVFSVQSGVHRFESPL